MCTTVDGCKGAPAVSYPMFSTVKVSESPCLSVSSCPSGGSEGPGGRDCREEDMPHAQGVRSGGRTAC